MSHRVTFFSFFIALLALFALSASTRAETLRGRYSYPLNPESRLASEKRAAGMARKSLMLDFLRKKFSKEIVDNLAEEISIALDPPDDYLLNFTVVSQRDDGDKLIITVEGEFDLPGMITALVQNKVL